MSSCICYAASRKLCGLERLNSVPNTKTVIKSIWLHLADHVLLSVIWLLWFKCYF